MRNFNTKTIITGAGVLLLLIAGAVTIFLMPSESDYQPKTNQLQTQPVMVEQSPNKLSQQNNSEPVKVETPSAIWYVYVTGAVKSPGVYKLSEDARIFQAIEAAGGFTSRADDTSLNLAEPLADGVHIHVATKGEREKNNSVNIPGVPERPSQVNGVTSSPSQSSGNLVDVNNASEIELQRLNGIGPAMAKRIIEYRQAHGAFSRPEDLLNVRGIGQATLNKIRSQIFIGNGTTSSPSSSIVSRPSQSSGNLVDVNHASESELQKLNGIGPALAKRIIEYRQSHGAFTKPEDLIKVRGIGSAKLEKMRSQILIR